MKAKKHIFDNRIDVISFSCDIFLLKNEIEIDVIKTVP
jgi:hypothetical protein